MQSESVQGEFVRRVQRLVADWPVAKAQRAESLALSVRAECPVGPMGSVSLWHGMGSWRPTLTLLGVRRLRGRGGEPVGAEVRHRLTRRQRALGPATAEVAGNPANRSSARSVRRVAVRAGPIPRCYCAVRSVLSPPQG